MDNDVEKIKGMIRRDIENKNGKEIEEKNCSKCFFRGDDVKLMVAYARTHKTWFRIGLYCPWCFELYPDRERYNNRYLVKEKVVYTDEPIKKGKV
jgi:hypothetical protein